jgi:hypothetical protein
MTMISVIKNRGIVQYHLLMYNLHNVNFRFEVSNIIPPSVTFFVVVPARITLGNSVSISTLLNYVSRIFFLVLVITIGAGGIDAPLVLADCNCTFQLSLYFTIFETAIPPCSRYPLPLYH